MQKKHFFPIILTAFFGNGIPAFLFTKAQTVLDSSLVGILNSLTPLFTLLLAVLFFKNKIKAINIAGILLGLVGAVYLNIVLSNFEFQLNFYALLIVLATLFYAISVNIIKNYLYDLDSVSIASLAFLFLGPFSAIYLFFTDFTQIYNSEKGIEALFYVIILSVIGTALALIIFNKLIKRTSAVFASSVTYLIPIVAILWGVFDGEEISMQFYAGTLIILLAIFMVNKKVK